MSSIKIDNLSHDADLDIAAMEAISGGYAMPGIGAGSRMTRLSARLRRRLAGSPSRGSGLFRHRARRR